MTQPGMTVVCGDSHTATHGAFGALAFGIGTSEVEHVLATQCLLQNRSKTYRSARGRRAEAGRHAKDIILALIARIGIGGGTGCVFEYCGSAIRALSMEERMTVCNMSIEAGARAGLVAPDDTTYQYVCGPAIRAARARPGMQRWRAGATCPPMTARVTTRASTIDAAALEPMITFGTNPGMGIPITAAWCRIRATSPIRWSAIRSPRRCATWISPPGKPLLGHPVNVVFIGSCTNSRISDLRIAARILKGRKVHPGVRVMVVPGSQQVKEQAQAEGLDQIFRDAGADWREAGCSMCIAMNGDQLQPGEYSVSTSNRNFEGRQGKGGRTFLASPLTAAASAITGVVTDVRELLQWKNSPHLRAAWFRFRIDNIDTDQIIPARFLKTISKDGLGDQLFYDWRYDAEGKPKPDFILNKPEPKACQDSAGRR